MLHRKSRVLNGEISTPADRSWCASASNGAESVIHRHDQVRPVEPGNPPMPPAILMQHHPRERTPRPLTPRRLARSSRPFDCGNAWAASTVNAVISKRFAKRQWMK